MKTIILICATILLMVSCDQKTETLAERTKKCMLPVNTIKGALQLDKKCLKGAEFPFLTGFDIDSIPSTSFIKKDKKSVYHLWFMECPPCIAEIPGLNMLKDSFADVNFISVCRNDENDLKDFLKKTNFRFNHIKNGKTLIEEIIPYAGFPRTIIIDEKNIILDVIAGGRTDSLAPKDIYDKVSKVLLAEN
ncbi:MAG TPA: TlpA disulfide reductase family protein [Saprospiraceae bacterium]|nr:TlpA disulfide reductase family protein [Saprospiraceae bacterium]